VTLGFPSLKTQLSVKAAQIDKAKKIFAFFCSVHSMALVVVMQYFGKAFKTFHEALQERKNDFSRKTRELRILN